MQFRQGGRRPLQHSGQFDILLTTISLPSPLLVSEHVVGHRDAVVHGGNVRVLPPPRETPRPAQLVSPAAQTGDGEE